jgi:hypothetical protein
MQPWLLSYSLRDYLDQNCIQNVSKVIKHHLVYSLHYLWRPNAATETAENNLKP